MNSLQEQHKLYHENVFIKNFLLNGHISKFPSQKMVLFDRLIGSFLLLVKFAFGGERVKTAEQKQCHDIGTNVIAPS